MEKIKRLKSGIKLTDLNKYFSHFKGGFFLFLLLVAAILCLGNFQVGLAWFGFSVAAYSTVANDSIQTLGTFLSSHKKTPWWVLWIIFGFIMVVVISYGWITYHHHVGFSRLAHIPKPSHLGFFEVLAPIVLLALTKFKIPVSTTFLILSIFSSDVLINNMLVKSCLGYLVAFLAAIILWSFAKQYSSGILSSKYNPLPWQMSQWIVTGILWIYWLMHDAANMVVFLPRDLSFFNLVTLLLVIFCLFGRVMYKRGTGIQEIVSEKKNSDDVRAATLIDGVFALVLIIFQYINPIPMSTTWVFLGVLAGRELILRADKLAIKLIISDVGRASLGIVISLFLVSLARGV